MDLVIMLLLGFILGVMGIFVKGDLLNYLYGLFVGVTLFSVSYFLNNRYMK